MQAPVSEIVNPPNNTDKAVPAQNIQMQQAPYAIKEQSTGLVNEEASIEIQAENHLLAQTTFEAMNLDPRFIKALYIDMGFNHPSLIQAQAIPYIYAQPRRNLIAQAQNGSGKTICFALGVLGYVNEQLLFPQVIVFAHTRELILQIHGVFTQLCRYTNIQCTCMMKDMPFNPQAQVIIGSIGAVKSAIQSNNFIFQYLVSIVLDEADEMLDNNSFSRDTVAIIKIFNSFQLPIQILLFSATFNPKVLTFAKKIAPGAVIIKKANTELGLTTVNLFAVSTPLGFESKCKTLDMIYKLMDIHQTCIFVNTREIAVKLTEWLRQKNHVVSMIHGGDANRMQIIDEFRRGIIKVLVCTDLLARGIDVQDITLVINFDIPLYDGNINYNTFLHRAGRTGRMGRKGVSFTFYENEEELKKLHVIEERFNMKVNLLSMDKIDEFEKAIKDSLN